MEPVFRSLEVAAGLVVRATGTRITFRGLNGLPATGGAVIAINHTGYVDFLPAALPVARRGRRMRFMIKAEMQQVKPVGYLIKHTGTIPVDRGAGAARMAVEAGVPIIPLIVWGAQRIWTKDHPKSMRRNGIPVVVVIGEPVVAEGSMVQINDTLRARMSSALDQAQQGYPAPAGAYWVPNRLGGSAPTPAQAKRLDEAELAERARKRADHEATGKK